MSVLFVLIMISGLIATVFLVGFIWSVQSGQYDDTYSPSVRMLFNEKKEKKGSHKKEISKIVKKDSTEKSK